MRSMRVAQKSCQIGVPWPGVPRVGAWLRAPFFSALGREIAKPGQPVLQNRQTLATDAIHDGATDLLVLEKASRFEHLQMARRRGPGVRKPSRDFSRRHGAAAKMHGKKHLPPG